MLNLYRLANRIPSAARMSYALLPENTMKSVLEDHAKVQAAPKIYKDWKVYRDPPPDVHLVRFDNEKLQYHSYNPPKGYTAEEIMQFGRAKQYLTLERAQELIERMEMDGALGWNVEDLHPELRGDGNQEPVEENKAGKVES